MPKINVYLPDDLAEAVRISGVPVSAVCQRALEAAVRRVSAIRAAAIGELSDQGLANRLPHFTARSRTVIKLATERARAEGSATVHTGHMLHGIFDEGGNMALQILAAMEIDTAMVVRDLADQSAVESSTADADGLHMSGAAANALELAVTEATGMAHNYVGCEHLLLGLVSEPDGRAGAVLRARGAEPKPTRRAIIAAIVGYAYRNGHAPATATDPALATAPVNAPAGAAAFVVEAIREQLAPLLERIERLEAGAD
jgi:ATP-dependent Clp protease ATP-binding subunit ClpA